MESPDYFSVLQKKVSVVARIPGENATFKRTGHSCIGERFIGESVSRWVFLRLVAISDIAHANDATLSPQLYISLPTTATAAWTDADGAVLLTGRAVSIFVVVRSRVGKSVRRGDEKEEEEEEGEKTQSAAAG